MISSRLKNIYILSSILVISFTTRFLYLGEIPGPVFDEVFYPIYGYSYLTDQQFFYAHPPLGNYILAATIWIYCQLPWVEISPLNTLSFEALPVLSYRWLNALSGSLLCILSYILSQKLFKNKNFSLLVCFFVAIDGSLLVDSRVGLINIYLVFFGLCALICAANAKFVDLQNRHWLLLCGVFIGLAASIKWNGLGYLLTILSFMAFVIAVRTTDALRLNHSKKAVEQLHDLVGQNNTFSWEYVLYFLIIPLAVYSLIWIPDLRFNTEYDFLEKHQQLLGYHQIMVTEDEHPYCSKWYSWPFMIRPISYYFNSYEVIGDLGNKMTMFQDIHLFPNPPLYWFSTIAILLMGFEWLKLLWHWIREKTVSNKFFFFTFILCGYCANLLPWAWISRCAFLYSYQPASIFGFFALAWYLAHLMSAESIKYRILSWGMLILIIAAFFYWLPTLTGMPLEAESWLQRKWFESWI